MKAAVLSAIPAALVLAFMTFTAEGQTPPAGPTVAYVSSQRLMNEVPSARAELARIQTMQQQKNNELRTKQQALESTRTQMASAPDAETRSRLQKQEVDQRTDLERATQQAQADMQRLQREVQAELQSEVKGALEQISRTQNFKLVLNSDTSVVWAAPGLDITNLLIDKMNAPAPAPKP